MASGMKLKATIGNAKYDFVDGIDADFGPFQLKRAVLDFT